MDHESDARQNSVHGQDEDRLAELGYKQELTRNWSLMHNFGVSFSIIVCFPLSLGPVSIMPSASSHAFNLLELVNLSQVSELLSVHHFSP